MNSLSWFLYLAEVIPHIGLLFGVISALGLIVGGVGMTVWTMWWASETQCKGPRPWFVTYTIFMIFSCSVMVLTPSKETIYLIAGSQAGEYVVNTPEAQEIIGDIQQIIRQQLDGMVQE